MKLHRDGSTDIKEGNIESSSFFPRRYFVIRNQYPFLSFSLKLCTLTHIVKKNVLFVVLNGMKDTVYAHIVFLCTSLLLWHINFCPLLSKQKEEMFVLFLKIYNCCTASVSCCPGLSLELSGEKTGPPSHVQGTLVYINHRI